MEKNKLRTAFTKQRKSISAERSHVAREAAYQKLKDLPYQRIASFFPIRCEIDLSKLNALLCSEKRLILPRIEAQNLAFYEVFDLNHLILSSWGIPEPNPMFCRKVSSIDAVLVPGLAFDEEGYRLGYGKGFYDRFLSQSSAQTIGIGFTEQKSSSLLPRDPWDLPVKLLFLF